MKCKVSKICGGCNLLHLDYEKQIQEKKNNVETLLKRNRLKLQIENVYKANRIKGYRNKIIVGFAKYKGKVVSGLYAPHSHAVVATKNCLMHPRNVDAIIGRITELVDSMKIELYNESEHGAEARFRFFRYTTRSSWNLPVR